MFLFPSLRLPVTWLSSSVTPLPLWFYCLHMYPSIAYCSVLIVLELYKKYKISLKDTGYIILWLFSFPTFLLVHPRWCWLIFYQMNIPQFIPSTVKRHLVAPRLSLTWTILPWTLCMWDTRRVFLKDSSSQTLWFQDPHSLHTVEKFEEPEELLFMWVIICQCSLC